MSFFFVCMRVNNFVHLTEKKKNKNKSLNNFKETNNKSLRTNQFRVIIFCFKTVFSLSPVNPLRFNPFLWDFLKFTLPLIYWTNSICFRVSALIYAFTMCVFFFCLNNVCVWVNTQTVIYMWISLASFGFKSFEQPQKCKYSTVSKKDYLSIPRLIFFYVSHKMSCFQSFGSLNWLLDT